MSAQDAFPANSRRVRVPVLSVPVDAISWNDALGRVVRWADLRESRYVCLCNAHSAVVADYDADFRRVLEQADLVAPDGMSIAWTLQHLGHGGQERISGPDLMQRYLAEAERLGQSVFFYGTTDATLARLRTSLLSVYPRLRIAGMYAPPFGRLSPQQEWDHADMINRSGANALMVGLGCPKQERWMARQRGRIDAVMIGVGAAFDYQAGLVERAPPWMQRRGLEWLHRLSSEPRRLGPRYLVTNTLFLFGVFRQLIGGRR